MAAAVVEVALPGVEAALPVETAGSGARLEVLLEEEVRESPEPAGYSAVYRRSRPQTEQYPQAAWAAAIREGRHLLCRSWEAGPRRTVGGVVYLGMSPAAGAAGAEEAAVAQMHWDSAGCASVVVHERG